MVGNGSNRPGRRSGISTRRLIWIALAATVVVICIAYRFYSGAPLAKAAQPSTAKPANEAKPAAKDGPAASDSGAKPLVVAILNSESITRDELSRECLREYGKEVLETMVNQSLIAEQCKQRKISVSQLEVDAEIDRTARKFALTKDQYLKLLMKERNIKPTQYGQDIVWPTLALRKLAAAQLTVTNEELAKGYESQFGEAINARLIVAKTKERADSLRAQAVAKPDQFGVLAKKFSDDVNSASANGMIQPIRRNLGDPGLEKAAFELKPGQISPVVKVGNLYAIVKCEGRIAATKEDRSKVDPLLIDAIRDRKLHAAATDLLHEYQKTAVVQNVLNDPVKSKQMPGVAAVINDHKIMIHDLTEACVERHGTDVLDGILNRRLLEQALHKRAIGVSKSDIDNEVARAALSMGKTKPSGAADVQAWLTSVVQEQHMPVELYIQNEVWPSVALKKLSCNAISVSEDDLKKGFEANYGPRVRCRAIILNNQRKAQEVWEKARENPTVKNFGDLAAQYSIESNSRELRGEVPPIQKFGGQPMMEREAFALHPGELSGVIQAGETFVILFCEGYTKPMDIKYAEVKQLIYDDLLEKKERIAMAKQFEMLKDAAQIDNYLAGTIKSPKRAEKAGEKDDVDDLDKLLKEPIDGKRANSGPKGNQRAANGG